MFTHRTCVREPFVSTDIDIILTYDKHSKVCFVSAQLKKFLNGKTSNDGVESGKRQSVHFGSFYLRIGAISFGMGSLVYDALEFVYFFEKYCMFSQPYLKNYLK